MTTREPYQIRVHLIEARGLKGQAEESDLVNPVIKVSLEAGQVKKSQRSAIYKDVRAPTRQLASRRTTAPSRCKPAHAPPTPSHPPCRTRRR